MDLMIDLETFSLHPHPAIVQIGAVVWDNEADRWSDARPSMFGWTISLQSSVMAGGHVCPQTVSWWRAQSPEARAAIEENPIQLSKALDGLAKWMSTFPIERVWAHGAATDIPWLAAAYTAVGIDIPWSYRHPRDTRTLFDIAEPWGWEGEDPTGTAHDAVVDAVNQAINVHSASVYLREMRRTV